MITEGKGYFDGPGGPHKPAVTEPKPPAVREPGVKGEHGDEGVTIHLHKMGDKFHSKIDKHDGYPADEMDHDTVKDAAAAHGQALEEKYGAEPTEEAEEKIAPGIHGKVGDYLSKMGEKV